MSSFRHDQVAQQLMLLELDWTASGHFSRPISIECKFVTRRLDMHCCGCYLNLHIDRLECPAQNGIQTLQSFQIEADEIQTCVEVLIGKVGDVPCRSTCASCRRSKDGCLSSHHLQTFNTTRQNKQLEQFTKWSGSNKCLSCLDWTLYRHHEDACATERTVPG